MANDIILSTGTLALIGTGTLAFFTWLLSFLLESVKKDINKRWDEKEKADQDYRKEQMEDAYRQQRSQVVMSDCLAQIMKHMITGNHIEDLEKQQQRLEAVRDENEQAMMRKATKYNLRRQ